MGHAEAARRTGVPLGTVASWASRAGVQAPDAEVMSAAIAAKGATIAQRKQALAERMLTEAESMIRQLHHRAVERKALVVSDGYGKGSHVEVAEVVYERPPTGDQKRIVESVAILVAQVQLLTGEATSRPELVGAEPAERSRALSVVEQLVQRSAS